PIGNSSREETGTASVIPGKLRTATRRVKAAAKRRSAQIREHERDPSTPAWRTRWVRPSGQGPLEPIGDPSELSLARFAFHVGDRARPARLPPGEGVQSALFLVSRSA